MQIKNAMPLARLMRALRFMHVFRGWDGLLRLLFHPDRQEATDLSFPFSGVQYRGSTAYLIDWYAFFYGAFERRWMEFAYSHIKETANPVVLDVGANVGHHSLWYAARGCTVHGFEPNPALWPRVEEKAAAEGLSGSITLHKTAMGAADETLSFFIPDGPNQGTGSFAQAPYNWEGEKTEFEVRNASALLEELGIDDVDLVKIDVEGFELEVMTGLKAFLQKCRPVVWVEVGAADADRRLDTETLKGFLGGDYRLYRSMPVSPFLTSRKFAEFSEIPDDMLVNVIAVPKN